MPTSRPITTAVRRRAWGEVPVRPWAVLAATLLVTAGALAVLRWREWRHEAWTIAHGTPVQADVAAIGLSAAREGSRDESLTVMLRYTPPGSASPLEAWGPLARKPGALVSTKQKLAVKVDPAQPQYWTERDVPSPIALPLVTPLACGFFGLACVGVAMARRRGVLLAYRHGDTHAATVASVRQSPLAPFSKLIGVTRDDAADRRVRNCYWPARCGPVHPGAAVDVIAAGPLTLAAAAYDAPAPLVPSPGMPEGE